MRHACAAVALVLCVLLGARAAAEPIHTRSRASCTTEGGSAFTVGPGYFLTEDDWQKLDLSLRDAQDARTRLQAENDSLRSTQGDGPGLSGWVTFGLSVGAGIAVALNRL